MSASDDQNGGPVVTRWSSDAVRTEQRRKLIAQARRWTDRERLAVAGVFYEELLTHYPLLRPHFEAVDVQVQTRKLAETLNLLLHLDDDRQRLGVEALRLGARHAHLGLGAAEYRMFAATLAHALAQFQNEVPYQSARQIWQADLGAISEVMLVVGADPDPTD